MRKLGFKGTVGVVFHLYGYESLIFPNGVVDPDWWLLPWHYWLPHFEPKGSTPEDTLQRKQVAKQSLKRWVSEGQKVCYIGDVALGPDGLDSVREFYDYFSSLNPTAYMGLGFPDTTIGARWVDVEEKHLASARVLYRELFAQYR